MKKNKFTIKDPRLRTAAAILLVTILGLVLWYQRIYAVKAGEFNALNAIKSQKEDRLTAIRIMKGQQEKLAADIAAKRRTLDSLKSIFPDQKEIPRLVQEVTRLARETNIATTRFVPMPDVVREYYVESRYNMTIWGGYHEFGGFVSRLANLKLIISLGRMKLTAHPALLAADSRATLPYTVAATFDLITFSSKK